MALPLFEKIIKKLTELEKNQFGYIPIGGCCEYYGITEPEGYMFPDGRALNRVDYPELFTAIGTTYGTGSGNTQFNLPDKRGYTSVMLKSESENFGTLGKKVGEETHKLTVEEMPSHNHSTTIQYGVGASGTGWNWLTDKGTNKTYNTNSVGGNKAHNNIQPSLVCNFLIRVK